ncbi:DUF3549 family protein [Shewanella sp. NIFS-20-20]|uniref:DUF3549 family protein n=1 Tax=Shewanella sp. NIFS-20-20 TaxID=2853806 RepID=UPI001C46BED7|nr:DUF3549 family protein [Shewanella sp. NIFS-20-20]MBV7317324.1 DUF3549 family protein [Shewanella sp. NIFS-20-20]
MQDITSLGQFFKAASTQFQVYDLGRRVQHIDMMAFEQIEQQRCPYPYPIQGHAQFAMVFWNDCAQHYIWFLKIPLDERGLLSGAATQQFLHMVAEAFGQNPNTELSQEQQDRLANHPFSFKPSETKLAVFNGLVRQQLALNTSNQYPLAKRYLQQEIPSEQWHQLGLQGLVDICVRLQDPQHKQLILNGLDNSPLEVKIALCQCLEHLSLDNDILAMLWSNLLAHPQQPTYFLQAMASSCEFSSRAIVDIHQQSGLTQALLISIAARNWRVLKQDAIRSIYLEALATHEQSFFNHIFADIVAIPELRSCCLSALRDPNRSATLSAAIGGLFQATTS